MRPCVLPAAIQNPRSKIQNRPMSPYRRNVMVGLTVLTALGVLGWMILKFGGNILTPFAAPRTPITIVTDRADGLADGSPILFLGQNVGQVVSVTRTKDNKSVMVK